MAPETAVYDVSTREGFLRRAAETTDRRIPPRYRHAVAANPIVTEWCETWGPDSLSLLILGVTGAGKTSEAYGAIRSIAASGIAVDWQAVTAPDLYASLQPREGIDAEAEFRRYADAPLLLLDDLGIGKPGEFTERVNYRLLGHRYDAMLPCLITSNVPVRQLKAMLGDRVASRLREMCRFVELDGPDRRKAPR